MLVNKKDKINIQDNNAISDLEELFGGYIYNINFDYLTNRLIIFVQVTETNSYKFYSMEFKNVSEIVYKTRTPSKPRNGLELTSIYIEKEQQLYTATLDLWFEDNAMKIVFENYSFEQISEESF